jgi:protein-L-isoaspartate(D-aspartate) O-methyltransferase
MPATHEALVQFLTHQRLLRSPRLVEAFGKVNRGDFVQDADARTAYLDTPLSIGSGATISAPHMHAMCATLLEPSLQPGARVLDVGSGSGLLCALFSEVAGPEGRVVGIDHVPALVAQSEANLNKHHADKLRDGRVKLFVGDGRLGVPELGPYDAIHVGAAAEQVPPALVEQLKPGGRMVIPVGHHLQSLRLVTKREDGSLAVADKADVRYVPLTDLEAQTGGQGTADTRGAGGASGAHGGGAPWFSGFL